MTDEKMAEEKYCKGCKWRIEQCLWAWRNTNGLKEPNEKNCSCKEVPSYIAGAEFGYNKCFEQIRKIVNEHTRLDCIIPELLRLKEGE
jgi:hypothetical protein